MSVPQGRVRQAGAQEIARGSSQPLRVLVAHNYYAQWGGEDVAFEQEVELLRSRGAAVEEFVRRNSAISPRGAASLRLAWDTVWSAETYAASLAVIRRFRPDVVHVHNLLPLISPSIFYAARREGVPVVHTIHNYRLVCPAATLYRNGRPCLECVGRATWRGAMYGCYRNSRSASMAVVLMLQVHRLMKTWQRVDAYIAVSQFVRTMLIDGGVPAGRIHVKPNYVPFETPPMREADDYAVYIGRLAPEKGVQTLIDVWCGERGIRRPKIPLKVAGTGPLEAELRERCLRAKANVEFMGRMPRPDALALLQRARFSLCPSEWYEPNSFSALESLASGVPVVAAAVGGFPDMLRGESAGVLFPAGDHAALVTAVERLTADPQLNDRLGKSAQQVFAASYSAGRNYEKLLEIYDAACARRGGR